MQIQITFTPDELLRSFESGVLENLFEVTKLPGDQKKPVEKVQEPMKKAQEPELKASDEISPWSEPADQYIPTVVELRAKAQEKAASGGSKTAIKKLLDEFDCKSISDVPEAKRAAFMSKLEAI